MDAISSPITDQCVGQQPVGMKIAFTVDIYILAKSLKAFQSQLSSKLNRRVTCKVKHQVVGNISGINRQVKGNIKWNFPLS